jgi:hypothetical protein
MQEIDKERKEKLTDNGSMLIGQFHFIFIVILYYDITAIQSAEEELTFEGKTSTRAQC